VTERLEIKAALAVNEAGEITGNAWPFNSADSVGDIITKGAFGDIAPDMAILFSHDPSDVIGTWDEVAESDQGLIVKGKLHMDRPRARSIRRLIQDRMVSGLSIGFRTREAKQQGRNRVITALDLLEISVVRNPSHPRARIASAKSFDSASHKAVAEAINRATAAQLIRNYR
jgi:HK97 family phage prohead protease